MIYVVTKGNIYIYTILQFPGSIYAIETRNPGPMYENKFFQLFLYKKNINGIESINLL